MFVCFLFFPLFSSFRPSSFCLPVSFSTFYSPFFHFLLKSFQGFPYIRYQFASLAGNSIVQSYLLLLCFFQKSTCCPIAFTTRSHLLLDRIHCPVGFTKLLYFSITLTPHQVSENKLYNKTGMRCSCKHLNASKIIKRPPNAFILFRQKFFRLLKDVDILTRFSTRIFLCMPDERELGTFGIQDFKELISILHSCLVYPVCGKFKSTEVSRYVSVKWNALPSETKKRWFNLANKEKHLHSLRFPNYRFCPTRKLQVRHQVLAQQPNGSTEEELLRLPGILASHGGSFLASHFEPCDFCKERAGLGPATARFHNWNKSYYELWTITIDVDVLKENLGLCHEGDLCNLTELCNRAFCKRNVNRDQQANMSSELLSGHAVPRAICKE